MPAMRDLIASWFSRKVRKTGPTLALYTSVSFVLSASFVVVNAGETNEPELRVLAHRLLVDVHALFTILLQVAILDEVKQVGPPRRVDFLRVRIGSLGQSDLRLIHIQEAHGVSFGHGARFFGVEGVVGGRNDFVTVGLIGKEAFERSDFNHRCLFLKLGVFSFEIRLLMSKTSVNKIKQEFNLEGRTIRDQNS
jgi:hypothetical protein